jgi:hypothetical protein
MNQGFALLKSLHFPFYFSNFYFLISFSINGKCNDFNKAKPWFILSAEVVILISNPLIISILS